MPPKRKVESPTLVDCVTETKSWYLDIFTRKGTKTRKVNLFLLEEDDSGIMQYQIYGQVLSVSLSTTETKAKEKCISLTVSGGYIFQLSPSSFEVSQVCKKGDDNMFARGFSLPSDLSKITCEMLHDAIVPLLNDARKNTAVGLSRKKDVSKEMVKSMQNIKSTILSMDRVDNLSRSNTCTTVAVYEPSDVVDSIVDMKKVKKIEKKIDFNLNDHAQYFPFGLDTQFSIPVVNCRLANSQYVSRSMTESYVKDLVNKFIANPNPPSTCAYLMPISGNDIPVSLEDVEQDKLYMYKYWIINGQHSIYAARLLLKRSLGEKEYIKGFYAKRSARIIVDAPSSVCKSISAIQNLVSQELLRRQPYLEILEFLRSQWIATGRPKKPAQGVIKGHESRLAWDEFAKSVQTTHPQLNVTNKQFHMIACEDEIYSSWKKILEMFTDGKLRGKEPTSSTFRCLMGLEWSDIKKIQKEILEGKIVIARGSKDVNLLDMFERSKEMKEKRSIKEALMIVFTELSSKKYTEWMTIKKEFNVNPFVYKNIVEKCQNWLKIKLQKREKDLEFPREGKEYVKWLIDISQCRTESENQLPWTICMASVRMEGDNFFRRIFKSVEGDYAMPISMCILDLTSNDSNDFKWTAAMFKSYISGILQICQLHQSIFLCFLKLEELVQLRQATTELAYWNQSFFGNIYYLKNSPCYGASQYLATLTFISCTSDFVGYSQYVSCDEKPSLDIANQPGNLLQHKADLIRNCIKCFCKDENAIVDAFSYGFVSQIALEEHVRVFTLVETLELYHKLNEDLLVFAKRNKSIKEWANIEDREDFTNPNVTVGKAVEEVDASSHEPSAEVESTQNVIISDPNEMDLTNSDEKLLKNVIASSKVGDNDGTKERLCINDIESLASKIIMKKSIFTAVLDMDGLLWQRCFSPSQDHISISIHSNKLSKNRCYLVLRKGCIEFLKALFSKFNVAIWSTTMEDNVIQCVRALQSYIGEALPFFAIWCRNACQTCSKKKIFSPDKPGVEAQFKPLAKLGMSFECDSRRTILIDNTPYRASVSPSCNCIFPYTFNVDKKDDNFLLGELLPYLFHLDDLEDFRSFIDSNRIGNPPVIKGHPFYDLVKDIIFEWDQRNFDWSQRYMCSMKLPIAPQQDGWISFKSEDEHVSIKKTMRQDNARLKFSTTKRGEDDDELHLLKNVTDLDKMKASELAILAKNLGYKGKKTPKASVAKAFIISKWHSM